jgi:uncharacterized protein HemX
VLANLWIAIAIAWTAVVFDLVSETAGRSRGIVAFGTVLAEPGRTVTLWVVAGLVASAVLALALALGAAWVRLRERRVAVELDARFERLAAEEASAAARRDQLARRLEELHRRIETLSRERQATEDVLSRERRRVRELRAFSHRIARDLEKTVLELASDEVVRVPDTETSDRPS